MSETIDIIVKESTDEAVDDNEFAEKFRQKIEKIEGVSVVSEHDQSQLFITVFS